VIDTLNPKPALFMLAFLPQFVDASAGSVVAQLVSLGLFFVVLAFVTGAAYALLAGRLSGLFRRRGERIVRAVSASVLLGMAAAVLILK
jgi:threonine/homoserine/homoserine lactone efflux protein